MSFSDVKLKDFPEFSAWYQRSVALPNNSRPNPIELAQCIAACLQVEHVKMRYDLWCSYFEDLVGTAEGANSTYQNNEQILRDLGINLTLFISDFATVAIDLDCGEEYVALVAGLADLTNLLSYRFLAAWLSLNLNHPERCILECEKVDDPYAAIYTLHGQALLEMGNAAEAIEILSIAVKLDPNESLAFFQLAKANLVLGDSVGAWAAAKECCRNSPKDPEVALILALIANDMTASPEILAEAWFALSPFLSEGCTNEMLIVNLLELAFKSYKKEWAALVVAQTDWSKVFSNPEIYKKIGKILRYFGENNWLDLAAIMLRDFDRKKLPLTG